MLDLNTIRAELASRLAADSTRFSMDAALAHVGRTAPVLPIGAFLFQGCACRKSPRARCAA